MTGPPDPGYEFAGFVLEPRERRLLAGTQAVELTPKAFDLLVHLVERAGHLVSKDEIMKALWPRGFVDEATLSNHVWQVRRALGDTAKTGRFIETIPKLGYRFSAPVTPRAGPTPVRVAEASVGTAVPPVGAAEAPVGAAVPPVGVPGPPETTAAPVPQRRRWALSVVIVTALLLVGALSLMAWRGYLGVPFGATVARYPTMHPVAVVRPSVSPPRVVALVQLQNLAQIAHDAWLEPALISMLSSELDASDGLRVVPYALVRDALAGTEATSAGGYPRATLDALRRRLDADYIVSGSYLIGTARSNPVLRVDLALQDARSGALLAAVTEQAEANELPELAARLGTRLRAKLGVPIDDPELLRGLANEQPPGPEVARQIGIAIEALDRHDPARARDALLESIALAPGYAQAYLYLSRAWAALGYREKALAAAEQAASRAGQWPRERQLQVALAVQEARYDWGPAEATLKSLVAMRRDSTEYLLEWIDIAVAAGDLSAARSALATLTERAANDPRTELAAARIAEAASDSKEDVRHAAAALQLARARQTPGLIADAELALSGANTRLGDLPRARTEAEASIADYRALGNPLGEAAAHRALAATGVPDLAHSREEYQRALALAQQTGDLGGVGAVYRGQCEMLWDAGDRDGAGAAARRALEISRQTGDLRLQAWTLRALATIAADEAASDEVLRDYREVTALTVQSHDAGGHAWSLITNADTLRIRGQLEEAQQECRRALEEAARLSDPQFRLYAQFTCASLSLDQGESLAAQRLLGETATLGASVGNKVYEGNAETTLGQIELEQSHPGAARELLLRAIRAFSAAEARTGEAYAQALLARCDAALEAAGPNAAAAAGPQDLARERAAAESRAAELRRSITARQEVYGVDIVLAQLASPEQRADAVRRLAELARDAERRHWVAWALEAQLAEVRLLEALGAQGEQRAVRAALETQARRHGFVRILHLLNGP